MADQIGTWVNIGAGLAEFVAPGEKCSATIKAEADAYTPPSSRYIVKKESGSEWARVIDTQTGAQIAKYSVLPRKRSTRDGWKEAENHAAKLNERSSRSAEAE